VTKVSLLQQTTAKLQLQVAELQDQGPEEQAETDEAPTIDPEVEAVYIEGLKKIYHGMNLEHGIDLEELDLGPPVSCCSHLHGAQTIVESSATDQTALRHSTATV
jgi:hypothetical protein